MRNLTVSFIMSELVISISTHLVCEIVDVKGSRLKSAKDQKMISFKEYVFDCLLFIYFKFSHKGIFFPPRA